MSKNSSSENKMQTKPSKANASTNINEPSPDHADYSKENEINEKIPFPLIEIETADSLWNSTTGDRSHGSVNDFEVHQRNSSNIFDSSTSAIFDESEIDIENTSFVSEISALAFSSSNISSYQNPISYQKDIKKRNHNLNRDSERHGRRKKKSKNRFSSEDDFIFNSPDHFFDYLRNYEDKLMPIVLSKRWNKKPLKLRKEIACAYRAEDARATSLGYENFEQKLREEEAMRRERIADFDNAHIIDNSPPIYDDQDKELEIDQNQLQIASPQKLILIDSQKRDADLQKSQELEIRTNDYDLESIDDSTCIDKKVNPLLILSLAIRFLFYIGYILDIC